MVEEEENVETVSSVVNTIVEQSTIPDDDSQDNDETSLTARAEKRSIASTLNADNDPNEMKRLRSSPTSSVA